MKDKVNIYVLLPMTLVCNSYHLFSSTTTLYNVDTIQYSALSTER